jgi:heme exporter protein B
VKLLLAVLARELRAEWRRRETVTTIVLFALLTLVTFVFSFDPARHPREVVLPGALWTAVFFAGMLGLNRSAARDAADGGLLGVVLSPADRGLLYLAKLCAQLVFLSLAEAVLLVFAVLWFDLDGRHLRPAFFALLGLGSIGFLSVGTVFAVIGQKTRLREVMLPVLLLPVLSPLILGLAEGTAIVLAGSQTALRPWFSLVGAFDLMFLTAGFLLYGFVLEE